MEENKPGFKTAGNLKGKVGGMAGVLGKIGGQYYGFHTCNRVVFYKSSVVKIDVT